MTILLCLLAAAAFYFDYHPIATTAITACAILALTLDTREHLITTRKDQS